MLEGNQQRAFTNYYERNDPTKLVETESNYFSAGYETRLGLAYHSVRTYCDAPSAIAVLELDFDRLRYINFCRSLLKSGWDVMDFYPFRELENEISIPGIQEVEYRTAKCLQNEIVTMVELKCTEEATEEQIKNAIITLVMEKTRPCRYIVAYHYPNGTWGMMYVKTIPKYLREPSNVWKEPLTNEEIKIVFNKHANRMVSPLRDRLNVHLSTNILTYKDYIEEKSTVSLESLDELLTI